MPVNAKILQIEEFSKYASEYETLTGHLPDKPNVSGFF